VKAGLFKNDPAFFQPRNARFQQLSSGISSRVGKCPGAQTEKKPATSGTGFQIFRIHLRAAISAPLSSPIPASNHHFTSRLLL
jgi:hypothetical protein